MRVLIVGSHKTGRNNFTIDDFVKACREIGSELAGGGHEIIIGSDDECTADKHVFNGYIEAGKGKKVTIARPEGGETPFSDFRNGPTHVEYSRKSGGWGNGRVRQIILSDVILLIGGGSGTKTVLDIAPELDKPVLSVPCFGGTAGAFWKKRGNSASGSNATDNAMANLTEQWVGGNSTIVVKALEHLVNNRRTRWIQWHELWLSTLLASLTIIWSMLLSSPFLPFLACAFLMMVISACLGAVLRSLINSATYGGNFISIRMIMQDFIIGISISFGFIVFYIAAGTLAIGSAEQIISGQKENFYRVASIMSAIGFLSALFIERSVEKLRTIIDAAHKNVGAVGDGN